MLSLRYALAACAAVCLAGGVAQAQPTTAPSGAVAVPPDQATPPPPAQTSTQAPANATPAASAGVNTAVTVDANGARHLLISNPPVPDTPENRAKYGAPLSNAGRHTQPAGN